MTSDSPTSTPLESMPRPPLIHVAVQQSLKDYIEANDMRPGQAMPSESFLARQLGVGRNSVREAIKALESLGILETRRGIGVFVKEFSFAPLLDNLAFGMRDSLRDVGELREIRRVLETGLIGQTIEVIGDDDIAALRDVTARMKARAEKHESFAAEDQEFHQLLFRCQNNRMLNALIDIFWSAFAKASQFHGMDNDDPLATWADHHAIVEAIARRDAEDARRRLDEHYEGLARVIARYSPNPG
ncbi:FadR family transcriptional regulator [Maritimibacter fusiformis]|uniref:FadR family transcriptional regulator n=2 Tax=Maritimibacter fusiformis TaxID=2603819 RepID=A0A5D0RJL8_9RHOB|nr:FadR family transcriptional regulator [Maritimibacter fusiformis]